MNKKDEIRNLRANIEELEQRNDNLRADRKRFIDLAQKQAEIIQGLERWKETAKEVIEGKENADVNKERIELRAEKKELKALLQWAKDFAQQVEGTALTESAMELGAAIEKALEEKTTKQCPLCKGTGESPLVVANCFACEFNGKCSGPDWLKKSCFRKKQE